MRLLESYRRLTLLSEPGYAYEIRIDGRLAHQGWSRGKRRDAEMEVARWIAERNRFDVVDPGWSVAQQVRAS